MLGAPWSQISLASGHEIDFMPFVHGRKTVIGKIAAKSINAFRK